MKLQGRIATYVSWVVLVVVFLFPIYWIVAGSFKTAGQQVAIPPNIIPTPFTGENYATFFSTPNFVRALLNSVIVTAVTVAVTIAIGVPAAYSLSRFRTGGRAMIVGITLVRIVPPVAMIVPFFMLSRTLGLHDTRVFLIGVYVVFNLPVAIWFLMGFLAEIPTELEESAMMDGCSRWRMLWSIVVPLLRTGFSALVVLIMLFSWNEFPLALTLTIRGARTLPVLVNTLVTDKNIYWGIMCAAGILAVIPIVVIGILVQKYLVRGLLSGAMKE